MSLVEEDNWVDVCFREINDLQIKTIEELKLRAIANKDKAPSESYMQGFLRACDTMISIFQEQKTDVTEGLSC